MEIEVFGVEGMRDEAAAKRVTDALELLAGVTSATADLDAETIEITYDASLVTVDALRTVIESEGCVVVN
jgi:copper chaperone CopZ